MRKLAFAGLVPLLLAAGSSSGTEHLSSPPLVGFKIGYQAANARQSIREDVPTGETVMQWTRIITTQRFGGLAKATSPATYLSRVIDGLEKACPNARWTPLREQTVTGRSAAKFMADCPLNPETGLPETFIFLAVAGTNDLLVKQVAWRKEASLAERQWGERYLASVRYCSAADKSPGC